jgi:hypothetical protein
MALQAGSNSVKIKLRGSHEATLSPIQCVLRTALGREMTLLVERHPTSYLNWSWAAFALAWMFSIRWQALQTAALGPC